MRWKNQDIPDNYILAYIENSERFQKKVSKVLGTINQAKVNMTPEERTARAKKAANTRWTSKKTAESANQNSTKDT